MTPLAISPTVTTYTSATPYLTIDEYKSAPTTVNTTNLIPNGTQQQNDTELANVIARASSWADRICKQVLAATVDIDPVRRYRVNREGRLVIPLRRKPILEVDAISYGLSKSTLQALTTTQAADLVIGASTIEFSPWSSVTTPECSSQRVGTRLLVQVTYVNGWPNTTLSAGVTQGDSSITVASALGIYPGSQLMIYDDAEVGEEVTVGAGYTSGLTLPLAGPLASDHTAGCSVSALPPVVKQAVISLTTALLKSRGSTSIQMRSATEPSSGIPADPAGPDVARAEKLLADFLRVR